MLTLQITRKRKTQLCFVRRKLGGVLSQGHGGWVLRLFSNIFQAFLSRNQSIYSYSQKTVEPVMTAYKLVTIQFKWWEQLFQCQSVANYSVFGWNAKLLQHVIHVENAGVNFWSGWSTNVTNCDFQVGFAGQSWEFHPHNRAATFHKLSQTGLRSNE